MKISEDDYRSTYLDPKVLEPLGYPYRDINYVRRGSSAGYKTYNRSYYPDYLFLVEGTPALVIEAKASERDFDYGFQEGLHHAKNYNPDRIIPFLLVAAGERVELFEARVAGLAIEFKKLEKIVSWGNFVHTFGRYIPINRRPRRPSIPPRRPYLQIYLKISSKPSKARGGPNSGTRMPSLFSTIYSSRTFTGIKNVSPR